VIISEKFGHQHSICTLKVGPVMVFNNCAFWHSQDQRSQLFNCTCKLLFWDLFLKIMQTFAALVFKQFKGFLLQYNCHTLLIWLSIVSNEWGVYWIYSSFVIVLKSNHANHIITYIRTTRFTIEWKLIICNFRQIRSLCRRPTRTGQKKLENTFHIQRSQ